MGSSADYTSVIKAMKYDQFVNEVILSNDGEQQLRLSMHHALLLREHVSRWCGTLQLLLSDLGEIGCDDITKISEEYLDGAIEEKLLPLLQTDTLRSVVSSVESNRAFKPPYTDKGAKNGKLASPSVTHACSVLLEKSVPLFGSLNKLPRSGQVFPVVLTVLVDSVLTLLSRAKSRALKVCDSATSFDLLGKNSDGSVKNAFSSTLERQKAFQRLMLAYDEAKFSQIDIISPVKLADRVRNGVKQPRTLNTSHQPVLLLLQHGVATSQGRVLRRCSIGIE